MLRRSHILAKEQVRSRNWNSGICDGGRLGLAAALAEADASAVGVGLLSHDPFATFGFVVYHHRRGILGIS
jgi:hypothetical protein